MTNDNISTGMLAIKALRALLRAVEEHEQVSLERDMGGNTLTIYVKNRHTHVGIPEEGYMPFRILLENIHNALNGGPGLSWEKENEEQKS